MSTTETVSAPRHASLRDASQRSATHRDDARSTGLATNDVRERYLARQQRYNRSEKGRARYARSNARRIFAGATYLGRAKTAEQAAIVTAHVSRMVADFVDRQRGEYASFAETLR